MADIFENPMGLNGFEFVEFTASDTSVLDKVFTSLGFVKIAKHRSKDVELYRQGDINFIVNKVPNSYAHFFAQNHGASACGMAFRVEDAAFAYNRALELGAEPVDIPAGPMELKMPAIKGIGGAVLYLIDRYEEGNSIYDIDFKYFDGVDKHPKGFMLKEIDHLTHNVYKGRIKYWADYYENLFNFKEIRYFDIKGEYTGLLSRAMSAPDGKIRIPLNEEGAGGGKGQIQEFLEEYNGEGIQHIALSTDNIFETVDKLRDSGIPFMTAPPKSYYEMLDDRLPKHGEKVEELETRGILMDGSTEDGDARLLLQIFTETMIGPIFIEIIQRKGDDGFGEGNFQALFESMERDQIRRGIIDKS